MEIETDQKIDCVLLGGGGHARVVIDCLRSMNSDMSVVVLDNDSSRVGTMVGGVPIIGDDSQLEALGQKRPYFALGIGSTRPTPARAALFFKARQFGCRPISAIHPSSIISPDAVIGSGCQVFAGAIINAGATLGDNVIVNTGAVIEHDSAIGDHVHIAPRACVGGGVTISANAHIGIGAVLLQSISVGSEALVGAGSVVIRDVPEHATIAGNPAQSLTSKNMEAD